MFWFDPGQPGSIHVELSQDFLRVQVYTALRRNEHNSEVGENHYKFLT